MQPDTGTVKLIVTGRWPHVARQIKSELRKAIPGAHIRSAGFRSVFILEAAGDVMELAQRINRDCVEDIGHATPALAEVESKPDAIKDAAVKIGTTQIGQEESLCFRIFKRGLHGLEKDTPEVLGPVTMVGVLRRDWRATPSGQPGKASEEHEKSATNAAAANPNAQAAP